MNSALRYGQSSWPFGKKYSSRLEELSGIQRHLMIPMFGRPCLEVHQWNAVRLALLQAAKGMPEDRDWLNEAVLDIEKTLRPEAFK